MSKLKTKINELMDQVAEKRQIIKVLEGQINYSELDKKSRVRAYKEKMEYVFEVEMILKEIDILMDEIC